MNRHKAHPFASESGTRIKRVPDSKSIWLSVTLNQWPANNPAEFDSFGVLGVRVDAVQIDDVVKRMEEWIAQREGCRYIAVTGMHGVTEAQHDGKFKEILNAAGLVVPDGYPLVWLGRRKGFPQLKRRVYGPELMAAFCEQTAAKG